jgi:hypothetical protein
MSLVRCRVRIAGDLRQEIEPATRGFGHGIVSWPEVLVLREIHGGDDSVTAIELVGSATTDAESEKARLSRLYDGTLVENLFPGASPRMQMTMPKGAAAELAADTRAMSDTPTFTLDLPEDELADGAADSVETPDLLGEAVAPARGRGRASSKAAPVAITEAE